MSESNGYDRHRMTGSSAGAGNNTLHRLSDGSGAQGQAQPQVAAAEGMLVGRVDGGSGGVAVHDLSNRSIVAGTAGAGPHVTAGTVFRPPHTVSDTRYGVAYSTAAGSSAVGSFSSLHAGVSHGAGLAQYTPLYNQYHSSYNASIMPGASIDQQQLGTYSAVLQNIGTQAAQRSPYANSSRLVPQYLPSMTQATSPATKSYPSIATLGGSHEREELRYKREQQQQEADNYNRRNSTGVMKDDKTHHFSGFTEPSRASYSSIRESPSKRELPPSTEFYKVPTGREGSLKHRILRPSESGSSTPTDNPTHSAFKTTDEPLPKRTKLNHAEIEMDSYRVQESSSAGAGPTSHLHYPQHFMMGSIIQLGNSEYKRIEDLKTDDFIHSAEISSDLKIDSSTVLHINENETQGTAELVFLVGEHKVQVPVEATVEHPFFVFGRGWSSCQPTSSMKRYGLQCHQLSRGDKCISLTHKEVMAHAAQISKQQKQQTLIDNAAVSLYDKEIKVENVAQLHVGGGRGNKSPGQAGSPAGAHGAYRSDTGHHVDSIKAERMFGSPRASPQLSAPSTAQEQMSHASPSIRP